MEKAAIISVSERSNLVPLAMAIRNAEYRILASSGTLSFLTESGIDAESIEDYTGFSELLDGRVKTLHPKIHAGILARRNNAKDMQQLESNNLMEIELVIVNLYPFLDKLKSADSLGLVRMLEYIDIGGPAMLRAAAKNFKDVLPVISPEDYPAVIEYLSRGTLASVPLDWRRDLASKVFAHISYYDLQIAQYLSAENGRELSQDDKQEPMTGDAAVFGDVYIRQQKLRYGENPHQKAAFYRSVSTDRMPWTQLNGKELSYNNILDLDSVLRILSTLDGSIPAAAIVKHNNPCGVAVANSMSLALQRAKLCDPRSHFGGIIGLKGEVDLNTAQEVVKDFAEIVVATGFSEAVLEVLRAKKNLRVLQVDYGPGSGLEFRSVFGGVLRQQSDLSPAPLFARDVQDAERLTSDQKSDLQLAWDVCRHCKSNSVVLAKQGMIIGVGAGQTSRIDAVACAINKAADHEHILNGAVAASDGFFPFSDSIESLAAVGILAIVAPAGSIKDGEVAECAKKLGVELLFVSDRHFRH